MSHKNREAKRSAREELNAQREREKARAKRKRTLIAAAGVVVVLGAAAGIAVAVADHGSGGGGSAGPVVPPPGATGKNNLVIPVGAADAPSTLTVYEDFRCPACDAFERGFTPTVHSLEDSGQLRTEYHIVTLIDGNLGGSGSLNAGNAAACAQAQGKFRPFHDVLYANQPDEQNDAFANNATLLALSAKVPGLRNAAFTSCVERGTHKGWVQKSDQAFNSAGFDSTPTVLLNGRNIYGSGAAALTPDSLRKMVAAANKGKKPGTVSTSPSPS
jgi:protein-disulfide isomerase